MVCSGQGNAVFWPIIPLPESIVPHTGEFVLTAETKIYVGQQAPPADFLNVFLKLYHGFGLQTTADSSEANTIRFELTPTAKEAYILSIKPSGIKVTGDSSGLFYGIQSLIQLIGVKTGKPLKLHCAEIIDSPRYTWRGMHLDCSRHFFTKEFVEKYIDLLASYKFNTFHWHLTDDQGWRIEIKKYPKLTSVGAWRHGSMVGAYSDHKFDTIRYGGFYTQNDIREVVAYARARHITIVPEIEMPGHSVAAIAAYPYLSCTGKQIDVQKEWGVFDDVYCTKDSTFAFMEDVLAEVMTLFPGKYIHIGGDECPKTRWKTCPHCQALIKKEGLKDEHELQSYFIRRIEKFVNAHRKQIIGWDEILEGGLAPNAAVMSWRGTEGGIIAARQKHMVVMTPGKPCYFDHYQSRNKSKEPHAIGGYNPLDSVYAYNPTPGVLNAEESKYIMGAQGNVWTEYILTGNQVEYMAVPRMCALAEVLWTPAEKKSFVFFLSRLKVNSAILDRKNIHYAKHFLIKK
ncbi:MAG: beta-N-acetylhexosaminidase [Bacteroidetes bacterium]|nr:beta-N-acetylhexosaminidase [Bacteroidota bacterium]